VVEHPDSAACTITRVRYRHPASLDVAHDASESVAIDGDKFAGDCGRRLLRFNCRPVVLALSEGESHSSSDELIFELHLVINFSVG
jgi:hypothetical protein